MSTEDDQGILIVSGPDTGSDRSGGWGRMSKEELKKQLASVIPAVQSAVAEANSHDLSYQLESVSVRLGVSAKGKVGIMGSGVETKGEAGITLVFKSKKSQ